MKPICRTLNEFIEFVKELANHGGVMTITTHTEVRMRKTNNPYIGAIKAQSIKVLVGGDYEKEVNDQRGIERKAEDFVAEEMKWGHTNEGVIVEHNDKKYLKTIVVEKGTNLTYMFGGKFIDYDLLAPFVPAYKPSSKQQLAEEVKVRTFSLENIIRAQVGDDVVYDVSFIE